MIKEDCCRWAIRQRAFKAIFANRKHSKLGKSSSQISSWSSAGKLLQHCHFCALSPENNHCPLMTCHCGQPQQLFAESKAVRGWIALCAAYLNVGTGIDGRLGKTRQLPFITFSFMRIYSPDAPNSTVAELSLTITYNNWNLPCFHTLTSISLVDGVTFWRQTKNMGKQFILRVTKPGHLILHILTTQFRVDKTFDVYVLLEITFFSFFFTFLFPLVFFLAVCMLPR